jgi:hypothetical protein
MQPERWNEIECLCDQALDREEDQRTAFLQSAMLAEDDPKNKGRQEAVTLSYATLGDTEQILASRPHMTASQQSRHWREARSWYQQALQSYRALRSEGALRGEEAGEPERVAQQIDRCDAALRKTPNSVSSAIK